MNALSPVEPSFTNFSPADKTSMFNRMAKFTRAGYSFCSKYKNVRRQAYHQRLVVCELLIEKANSLFIDKKFEDAMLMYSQALSIYRFISIKPVGARQQSKNNFFLTNCILEDKNLEFIDYEGDTREEKIHLRDVKIGLYNKLAYCYAEIRDYENAIYLCNESILLDHGQSKTWYQRAKAIVSQKNLDLMKYTQARDDLKIANSLNPKDSNIKVFYKKVAQEVEQLEKGKAPSPLFLNEKTHDINSLIQANKPPPAFESSENDRNQTQNSKSKRTEDTDAKASPLYAKEEKARLLAKSKEDPKQKKFDDYTDFEEETKTDSQNMDTQESLTQESSISHRRQLENDNEVWKMLHGDADPNSRNFDYSLSFEVDPNAKTPDEIKEFGRIIEKRGKEAIRLYERSGKQKELAKIKENLKQAMWCKVNKESHKRLENISKLDFNRPGTKLKRTAQILNLDLNDLSLKEELKKVQAQNLEDVRKWLKAAKGEDTETVQIAERKAENPRIRKREVPTGGGSNLRQHPSSGTEASKSSSRVSGFFSRIFGDSSEQRNYITTVKRNDEPNLQSFLERELTQQEIELLANKGKLISKLVIYLIVASFIFYLLMMDQKEGSYPNTVKSGV